LNTLYFLTITSCPSPEIAQSLAEACVKNKVAACVNILPAVQSIYQWQGKIERDTEVLLFIKTVQSKLAALQSFILKNHPYEIPEFIAIKIESGSKDYLDWIQQSLHSGDI